MICKQSWEMLAHVKQILANLFQNDQPVLSFELEDCKWGHVPFNNLAKPSCVLNLQIPRFKLQG